MPTLSSPSPFSDPVDRASIAWYLVYTKPRQEEKALINLERQGYRCYLPRLTIERIRLRRLRQVPEAMFPRYLFIHLDSGHEGRSWSPIRSTLGVQRLVYFGAQPAKVDDRLVEMLREREQQIPPKTLFAQGDRVQVVSGPLAGLEAVYQMADGEQRALLLLEILSQMVSVPVDAGSLKRLE